MNKKKEKRRLNCTQDRLRTAKITTTEAQASVQRPAPCFYPAPFFLVAQSLRFYVNYGNKQIALLKNATPLLAEFNQFSRTSRHCRELFPSDWLVTFFAEAALGLMVFMIYDSFSLRRSRDVTWIVSASSLTGSTDAKKARPLARLRPQFRLSPAPER